MPDAQFSACSAAIRWPFIFPTLKVHHVISSNRNYNQRSAFKRVKYEYKGYKMGVYLT